MSRCPQSRRDHAGSSSLKPLPLDGSLHCSLPRTQGNTRLQKAHGRMGGSETAHYPCTFWRSLSWAVSVHTNLCIYTYHAHTSIFTNTYMSVGSYKQKDKYGVYCKLLTRGDNHTDPTEAPGGGYHIYFNHISIMWTTTKGIHCCKCTQLPSSGPNTFCSVCSPKSFQQDHK